jgi:tetratricopeptide (TPR) repeat protein
MIGRTRQKSHDAGDEVLASQIHAHKGMTSEALPIKSLQNSTANIDNDVELDKLEASANLGVATSLANLAALYEAQGLYKKAESLWRRIVRIRERLVGTRHPLYAQTLQSLATFYVRSDRPHLAVEPQEQAVAIIRATMGEHHPDTATSLNQLAVIYIQLARYKDAAPLIEQALAIRSQALGPTHPSEIPMLQNLLAIYQQSGDDAKAKAIEARLRSLRAQFPDVHN